MQKLGWLYSFYVLELLKTSYIWNLTDILHLERVEMHRPEEQNITWKVKTFLYFFPPNVWMRNNDTAILLTSLKMREIVVWYFDI